MTPRVRGGRSGFSCGYGWVMEGRSACLSVTPRPFIRPRPVDLGSTSGAFRTPRSSTAMTLLERDLEDAGAHELQQRQRDQHEPRDPLQLILAQAGVGDAEPDDEEGERPDLREHPQRVRGGR